MAAPYRWAPTAARAGMGAAHRAESPVFVVRRRYTRRVDIGTRRLRLRPVAPVDAGLLNALDADPEVMRFVSGGEPTPTAVITDWVIPRSQAQFRDHGTGLWLAFDRRTQAMAGWVWLRLPRHSAVPELELSYRLARESWHRGLATEASRALVDVAFTTTATERVFAGTHPDNVRSQRVMQKLGMRLATENLQREHFDDGFTGQDVEYEVLRRDWLRNHRPATTAAPGRHHRPRGPAAEDLPA
ncbi:GNAT family N-acetyltransferase [Gordonia hydrophobica]|uniref:GNAT family N-acetyltransferase n=1 Tax=Gordonia hydrophobica TaxID=40516 RepID=A0ABZ2U027_9ACTN|nr:GNAT family N-acetyltransferase [Gordonia hydrophobica]MBM7368932.1 RimJ/RimL family protein N-acetyltransferase [Gordonia hydrophobica]